MLDFEKYGLRGNPFDPGVQSRFMADRKNELKRLEISLKSAFSSHAARFILIQGDYGLGKTHMLNYIYTDYSSPKGVLVENGTLLDRPLALMETEPRSTKFGLGLICRIFDNLGQQKVQEVLSKVTDKEMGGKFANLFLSLQRGSEVAYAYISGKQLSTADLRNIGMRGTLSDSETGLKLFFEWLRLIKVAGYHTFLILIDEFEYIFEILGDAKISQVLNTFREVFDRSTELAREPGKSAKPVFVFAISPGGWERVRNLATASVKKTGGGGIGPFMRRLNERDQIHLEPFSLENTKELVKLRLSDYRIKSKGGSFSPFTEDAIEYVHLSSLNKPANVIKYCMILLEDALLEENLNQITRKDAERILSKYGIAPPRGSI